MVVTPAADIRLKELEEARQEVQRNLEARQSRKEDGRTTKMMTGDKVWLEGKNLHVTGTRKLLPKRYGPFVTTLQSCRVQQESGGACAILGMILSRVDLVFSRLFGVRSVQKRKVTSLDA